MAISRSDLLELFPPFRELEPKVLDRLLREGQVHYYPADRRLFHEGEHCDRFLLLLKGSVRVQKLTDNGHEIVLYHIAPGQSCRLTNTCLLGGQRYPAEAFSETEVELLSLSRQAFQRALELSGAVRAAVYSTIDEAMNDLVRLVQDVAFGHLDHRLAQFLLQQTQQQAELKITHQALATELGTAREVVSRLLKEFERQGWVKLQRGRVIVVEREALSMI